MSQLKAATSLIRGYRRALGLVDPGGVDRLGDTLQPTIDLWGRLEWAALQELLYGAATLALAAGGAGFRSMAQLWNPAGSGRLLVVEGVAASVATSVLTIHNVALGTLNNVQIGVRDLRLRTQWVVGRDYCIKTELRSQIGAAKPATAFNRFFLINGGVWYPIGMVVPPGTGVALDPNADNTAFTSAWLFYERDILAGEGAELI